MRKRKNTTTLLDIAKLNTEQILLNSPFAAARKVIKDSNKIFKQLKWDRKEPKK